MFIIGSSIVIIAGWRLVIFFIKFMCYICFHNKKGVPYMYSISDAVDSAKFCHDEST